MERTQSTSDNELDEGLYNEFEASCTSVSQLFKNHCWRSFQNAAVHTTQLYKGGIEARKRAMEKGVHAGRLQLAKEILSLKRYSNNKIDVQELYNILGKYALIPNDHQIMSHRQRTLNNPIESSAAVNLFQQALTPSNTSPPHHSSQRGPPAELNSFLQHQVHRHRKRAHSPMSPMDTNGSSPTAFSYSASNHFLKRRRLWPLLLNFIFICNCSWWTPVLIVQNSLPGILFLSFSYNSSLQQVITFN